VAYEGLIAVVNKEGIVQREKRGKGLSFAGLSFDEAMVWLL